MFYKGFIKINKTSSNLKYNNQIKDDMSPSIGSRKLAG